MFTKAFGYTHMYIRLISEVRVKVDEMIDIMYLLHLEYRLKAESIAAFI